MTTLEKILYVADYMEPRRNKAPDLARIRLLAFQDLDETVYQILKGTLEYLEAKGGNVHPTTRQAYEYYNNRKN